MRKPTLLIVLLLVLTLPTVAVAQSKTPHSLKAVLEGTMTWVPFGSSYFDVYALGVARGTAQGLGQTELFSFHQAQASGSPILTHFFLVAANGDRITGTYEEGHATLNLPKSATLTATFLITGGTGRFAKATGELKGTLFMTPPNGNPMAPVWPAVWTFEGWIAF